jgi:hypothetical protein
MRQRLWEFRLCYGELGNPVERGVGVESKEPGASVANANAPLVMRRVNPSAPISVCVAACESHKTPYAATLFARATTVAC